VVPIQDPDPRAPLQELPAMEEPAEYLLGHCQDETKKHPGPVRGRDRAKIAELSADEW